jgi:hypothetical protein
MSDLRQRCDVLTDPSSFTLTKELSRGEDLRGVDLARASLKLCLSVFTINVRADRIIHKSKELADTLRSDLWVASCWEALASDLTIMYEESVVWGLGGFVLAHIGLRVVRAVVFSLGSLVL